MAGSKQSKPARRAAKDKQPEGKSATSVRAQPDGADDSEPDKPEIDEETLVEEVAEAETVALVDGDDADVDFPVEAPSSASTASVAKYDPMAAYMREVRRFPLLSRDEEHELAVKWQEGGEADAARRLVEANLRLVVKISYEYRRAYRNILDLVQEGNIGLMQAVRKYDPHRGVKLSSYAAWWIRAYILKFILNNWRLVKIGTTQAQRKLFFNLRKEREKLEQLGFEPEPKMLAERLDVREKDVIEMQRRMAAPDASLDAPIQSGDEGSRTRLDMMSGSAADRPDVVVEASEFQALLKEKLEVFAETLEGREETIFRQRWLTDAPVTLQELGDQFGVSRERARQVEKRLLGRLRTYLEQELGSAVDIQALPTK